MYIPGCSCIFTGRWSMLDGLQICENEPNFDSNIIHNIKPGVEKKKQQNGPMVGVFSVSQVVQEEGDPAFASTRVNYISKRQECVNSPVPHHAAPVKKKTESCHDSEVAHWLLETRMKKSVSRAVDDEEKKIRP